MRGDNPINALTSQLSGSSKSILMPQRPDSLYRRFWGQIADHVMVDAHQRRAGACPQTGVELERYLIVLSLALTLKAQLIKYLFDDVGRAL